MDPDTPTHFNIILVGTGLVESILAAALSKSGYSVLQLDQQAYYGDEWASLSLPELLEWSAATPGAECVLGDPDAPARLGPLGQRFALSLKPTLLRASGTAIDVLVRSKVAAYLQFGMLNGVGQWRSKEDAPGAAGEVERVPASKADVFNHPSLSLVEKRRLTKLLLFAAGPDALEESPLLSDRSTTFETLLRTSFSLSPSVAGSLAYALSLCSSPTDLALPALQRLRSFILSTGRYGPSPFLVGHYGGAGDLVGGFSRICAVWGGGQILGRPIEPLVLDATPGTVVPPSQAPFLVHNNLPPPPAQATADSAASTRPLGVPVQIESDKPASVFTGDWIISSSSHLATLLPDAVVLSSSSSPPISVHAIVVLPSAVPFPPPREPPSDDYNEPDSSLFVFPPGAHAAELGTVTALQVGPGTCATPAGHFALYLSAPILTPSTPFPLASALLSPYISSLLSLSAAPHTPILTTTYFTYGQPTPPSSLPPNLLVVPSVSSEGTTARLATALDEAIEQAEELFWRVVGDEGRKEGVLFFAKDAAEGDDDD